MAKIKDQPEALAFMKAMQEARDQRDKEYREADERYDQAVRNMPFEIRDGQWRKKK